MKDNIDTRRMTVETIGRALDHHRASGAIQRWHLRAWELGGDPRWVVVLAGDGPMREVEARSKREVGILLAALTSAEYAARAGAETG
jgi:hypothetical protein